MNAGDLVGANPAWFINCPPRGGNCPPQWGRVALIGLAAANPSRHRRIPSAVTRPAPSRLCSAHVKDPGTDAPRARLRGCIADRPPTGPNLLGGEAGCAH